MYTYAVGIKFNTVQRKRRKRHRALLKIDSITMYRGLYHHLVKLVKLPYYQVQYIHEEKMMGRRREKKPGRRERREREEEERKKII